MKKIFNFFILKFFTLAYRFELILEYLRLIFKKDIELPIKYIFLILKNPTLYDDYISFLNFISNKEKITFIDVGANNGQYSKNFILFYSNTDQILLFEPIKKEIKNIKSNLSNFRNKIIFCCAIGKKNRITHFHYNEKNTTSASIFEYSKLLKSISSNNNQTIKVKEDSLNNYFKYIDIKNKLIIKIDVQGNELQVVKNASKFLKKADLVIVETSFVVEYQNQKPSFSPICALLLKYDLYPVHFQGYSKDNSFYAYERDVIFVRKKYLDNVFY
jgi:FkbM family methyltransferase